MKTHSNPISMFIAAVLHIRGSKLRMLMQDFGHHMTSNEILPPSAAEIFLPVRGRGVGGEEGLRRRLHAGLLCLLSHRQTNRAQPAVHQPVARPEQMGEDGRLPGPRTLHLHLRRPGHHRASPQRERGDRDHGP